MPVAYERRCSECGASLAGRKPDTITCSDSCRNKRTRRLAKENRREVPATQQLAQTLNGEYKDAAREVIQQELAPVVREAMTEDVIRSISQLVALTPTAVQAIGRDLEDEDPVIRQRAYTLLLKYTVGHPAVVQPKDADPNAQMVVNFNLPRPSSGQVIEGDVIEEDLPTRTCDECGKTAPETDFVGASERCKECFERREAEVRERFGDA